MAKSNAEIQREYRRRQKLNADESQINMYLPASDHATLRRLAAWRGKTIKQWLCDTVREQEKKVLGMLVVDGEQWHKYFGTTIEEEKRIDAVVLARKTDRPELELKPDRHVWACPDCGHAIEAKSKNWLTRYKRKHVCN